MLAERVNQRYNTEETEYNRTIMMNTNTNITLGTGDSFVMLQDLGLYMQT